MNPSVDIGNVTLTYRGGSADVLALEGTSLRVARGEFAAVVGPSGCGKSSLMKLVTGLIAADAGEVVIFGHKVHGPVKIAGMARTPSCASSSAGCRMPRNARAKRR